MDVDTAESDASRPAPCEVHELIATEGAPGVRGQGREQLELARPEMHGTAIAQQFVRGEVEDEALRDRQIRRPSPSLRRLLLPAIRLGHDGDRDPRRITLCFVRVNAS